VRVQLALPSICKLLGNERNSALFSGGLVVIDEQRIQTTKFAEGTARLGLAV